MHRVRFGFLVLGGLLAASACSSPSDAIERCREVCRREAQCVDKVAEKSPDEEEQTRFDQSECISACNVLTRDPQGRELVDRHVSCVERAGDDCEALLACE